MQQKGGAGTPEIMGIGGPVLECGDTKIARWEQPARQIEGQVMSRFTKQRKNEIKCVSHFATQVTLYSGKSLHLV